MLPSLPVGLLVVLVAPLVLGEWIVAAEEEVVVAALAEEFLALVPALARAVGHYC